jgi:prepilin-type processing-associated H-X9-DG protein
VVIGLIGLLIALLLPAMNKARKQAAMVQCCSNLHQIGIAWTMYLGESRGRFPLAATNLNWFYGGKQPCGFDSNPNSTGFGKFFGQNERLLNPYLGSQRSKEQRAAVFRCPKDGPIQGTAGANNQLTLGMDAFDYFGNSYMMSPGLLSNPCRVLAQVHFPSSKVVICGDCEWYFLANGAAWNGDFHQSAPRVNLVFLDGHAATCTIVYGQDTTEEYSFAIAPEPPGP